MMKRVMLSVAMGTAVLYGGDQRVVSLSDLTGENIENFTQGKLQNVIVACPAGMVLPLTLSLQGKFLTLESKGESSVTILKTCFVKCVEETFFFSLDGKSWKEFSDFFTGKLSAEFYNSDHNSDKGSFVSVGCELHLKQ